MKYIIILLLLALFDVCLSLKRIIKTSNKQFHECQNRGYFYKNYCFCLVEYTGDRCQYKRKLDILYSGSRCDNKVIRLDNLFNISPDAYKEDDNEFPRLTGDSIGQLAAAYGKGGEGWIRMHDVVQNFKIFGDSVTSKQVKQGSLGNCYLIAALASIAQIENGKLIKDAFITKTDNQKHVYITKWMIDGKPRLVAVDEWIPKQIDGNEPAFGKPSYDGSFWSVILEKAWAKIQGQYMETQGGNPMTIYQSFLEIPINMIKVQDKNSDEIFNEIQNHFKNEHILNTYTYDEKDYPHYDIREKQVLIFGHAYGVLNALEVELDDGSRQKLIQVFNPWNKEEWVDNPWGGQGSNWSEKMKQKYDVDKTDGAFHLTPEDFKYEFQTVSIGEYNKDYENVWLDVPFKKQQLFYNTQFETKGLKNNQNIILQVHRGKQNKMYKCKESFQYIEKSLEIYDENDKKVNFALTIPNIQMNNLNDGKYTMKIGMELKYRFIQYFTIQIYAPQNTVQFVEKIEKQGCLNDCNGKGTCDTNSNQCHCFEGYAGIDCSEEPLQNLCPNKCNGNGQCDQVQLICKCYQGYIGEDCQPCKDQWADCHYYVEQGDCEDEKYQEILSTQCQKSCGESGSPFFKQCQTKDTKKNNLSDKSFLNECPKNCNGNGECDKNLGKCICKQGYMGEDCQPCSDLLSDCSEYIQKGMCDDKNSLDFLKNVCYKSCAETGSSNYKQCFEKKYEKEETDNEIIPLNNCPDQCNGNGECDKNLGKCICKQGFMGEDCQPCSDLVSDCSYYVQQSMCDDENQLDFLKRICYKSCAKTGSYNFKQCFEQNSITSDYLQDQQKDQCQYIDCGYNGQCENGRCICNDGYTGTRCQEKDIKKECFDKIDHVLCQQQKQKGYCEEFPYTQEEICRKTCGFC